jgi:hypothetical protein
MFDMRQCKAGDKLLSRDGKVYLFQGKSTDPDYQYYVIIPNVWVHTSRTEQGRFYVGKEMSEFDIVGFAEKQWKELVLHIPPPIRGVCNLLCPLVAHKNETAYCKFSTDCIRPGPSCPQYQG